MRSRIFLLFFLLLALPVMAVEARELVVEATDVVAIRPSVASQDMRLLIKFALPEALSRNSVDFACAEFDVGCRGAKGAVSLEAFQVTTAWDKASVSWAGPWKKVGGDWDDDVSAECVLPVGDGKTAYLDITDFVNVWLEEPSKNFGILVKVSEPLSGSFSRDEAQGRPRLRILY
ncbi:MAG: DNRLRE domain-containing protein [Candidatus Eisenbacteria bacterium]|nr:DNRLRE domain-containing protein [Candidatus Eisenbacteria bacterium]